MSTITDLEAGTTGSSSMGIINTNFDNLNTDKIEADSTDTLENKTIDADLNTITDLTPTNIKSGNKTGADTFIVTGTKGDVDEIAKWNADGDLVSTDVTITTTAPTASSSDLTIPTSQAVQEAIDAQLTSKERWFSMVKATDADTYVTTVGSYPVVRLDATDDGYFVFCVPADFETLTALDLIMIPDATESISIDITTSIAAEGEVYTLVAGSASNVTKSVTINVLTAWELSAVTGTPFAGMDANDFVGVTINSDTSSLQIIGLRLRYT